MNKVYETYEDLISDAYDNYTQTKVIKNDNGGERHISPVGHYNRITKEEFENKIIENEIFANSLELTITQRFLSLEERQKLCVVWTEDSYDSKGNLSSPLTIDWKRTPKRAIAITYNGQTQESYIDKLELNISTEYSGWIASILNRGLMEHQTSYGDMIPVPEEVITFIEKFYNDNDE
jgi:hypothetical protein